RNSTRVQTCALPSSPATEATAPPAIAVRLFAGAAAEYGRDTATVRAASLEGVIEALTASASSRAAQVIGRSSFLVNAVACTDEGRAQVEGDRVDVLPAFAGGGVVSCPRGGGLHLAAVPPVEPGGQGQHCDPALPEGALGAARAGPGGAVEHGTVQRPRAQPFIGAVPRCGQQVGHCDVLGATHHAAGHLVILTDVDHAHPGGEHPRQVRGADLGSAGPDGPRQPAGQCQVLEPRDRWTGGVTGD